MKTKVRMMKNVMDDINGRLHSAEEKINVFDGRNYLIWNTGKESNSKKWAEYH